MKKLPGILTIRFSHARRLSMPKMHISETVRFFAAGASLSSCYIHAGRFRQGGMDDRAELKLFFIQVEFVTCVIDTFGGGAQPHVFFPI